MKRADASALSPLVVVAVLLALAPALGCGRPALSMRAPARVEQALTVVGDLGATATLVPSGGEATAPVPLLRGDDGVTFSGFLDATPGQYTLAIVFDGVPEGDSARHFLGRLTSDAFTVTAGAVVRPVFSTALDTVGRAGDGGDDDDDGLGFLDELLLGADPTRADTDGDGLADGKDCGPTEEARSFEILEGGSVEDCDADGFRAVTAPLGEPGEDCDDENAGVHPGIDDDCGNDLDEDCNPQTCPIADFEGPAVEVLAPAEGTTIGCNAPFIVEAVDPSDVTHVLMTATNQPLPGGTARTVALVSDGDDLTWRAANGFGFSGGSMADGPLTVDVTGSDTAANQTTVTRSVELLIAYPEVTMAGPDTIVDGPAVSVTVTPQGPRPLSLLELRAAPYDPATSQVDVDEEIVLGALPTAGGSVSVDPADLAGDYVVYPVAVDDIGNAAAPQAFAAFFSATLGINAGFFCDGVEHDLPAIARRADIDGPITLLAHLQEAIDIATAAEPTAYLTQVIGFGVDTNGLVDLSRTDSSVFVAYKFMTPEAVAQAGSDAESISVTWYGAASAPRNPVVDPTGSFLTDEIVSPASLIDSDVVAAAYACGGNGLQGTTNDFIMYTRDVDGAIPGTDEVALFTADEYSWTTDATNLSDLDGFCCTPTGCS